jgi:predicted enzyme related to lactoylglutathione lyase
MVAVESVGYVILYVRDVDASVAFYRDALGLPFELRDAGYAEFVTGETKFGLLERTRASDLIHREPTEGGPAGEVLFLVDDVDAEAERLRPSASSSSPARWTAGGGTGRSTSSIPTGSWSSWPRRSPWLRSTTGCDTSPAPLGFL